MPTYLLICPVHGQVEHTMDCKTAMAGATPCPVLFKKPDGQEVFCSAITGRDYRAHDVGEFSDNRYPGAGRLSHELGDGGKPVYIATAREERALMAAKGLSRWEPGMGPTRKSKADDKKARKARRKKQLLENYRKRTTLEIS